jgi:predicted  nucleic acid-binding Zn-ribbon protein
MKTSRPYPNESDDLELHVSICAERYSQLDTRLEKLELDLGDTRSNIDAVRQQISDSNSTIKNTVITTAGTILVAVIAVLGTILAK